MTAAIAYTEVAPTPDLMLGELPVGAIVFHPYYRLGKVVARHDSGVSVHFAAEFDYRTRTLVREGKLLMLGYHERIATWEA